MGIEDVKAGPGAGGGSGGSGGAFVTVGTDGDYATMALAIAAGETDLWLLPGTHTLSSAVDVGGAHRTIQGGGDSSVIDLASNAIFAFLLSSDHQFTFRNFRVTGNSIAASGVFKSTLAGNNKVVIENVNVGSSFVAGTLPVETFIDLGSHTRFWFVRNCAVALTTTATTYLLKNGTSTGEVFMDTVYCFGRAQVNGSPVCRWREVTVPLTIATDQAFGASSRLENCSLLYLSGITLGINCAVIGGVYNNILSIGADGVVSGARVGNSIIAAGARLRITGTAFVQFFSNGFNGHIIQGASGGSITLSDSSQCVVEGVTNVTITETGTSDFNQFSGLGGTTTVTQVGANSTVEYQGGEYPTLISNVDGNRYSTSGIPYIPLAKAATEEYVEFSHVFRKSRLLVFDLVAAMSTSNGGNVALEVDYTLVADSNSPNNSLTTQTAFIWLPGTGTQKKTLKGNSRTSMQISGAIGQKVWVRVTRKNVVGDTHSGSMNVIDVVVN